MADVYQLPTKRGFDRARIASLRTRTPFFVVSPQAVLHNLTTFLTYLPQQTEICYAMKANSERHVLTLLHQRGASFEVASKYELTVLKAIGVPSARIIFGTSVKPERHIKDFAKYGVDRFAFDSEEELFKIARSAPGSRVYVRAHVDDRSGSVFNLSEKFGTSMEEAVALLMKAKELGLVPYGISFNVGSQAKNVESWARGLRDVAVAMVDLTKRKVEIEVINIGGGFPHSYQDGDQYPSIEEISEHIHAATKQLPYRVSYLAEPGRALVANAFVLVTRVIGRASRANGEWLYLDAGVYNALFESLTCQGSTRYRIKPLTLAKTSEDTCAFIVAGPTGDNLDIVAKGITLPRNVRTGDTLLISDVGAYTFPLITKFNGFPKPKVIAQ